MNTWLSVQSALSHPLTARLVFVSAELAVLAAAVALLIRLARIRAPRVRALLWLLVLAKPILGLAVGAPFELWSVERPAAVELSALPGDGSLDAMLAAQLEKDRAALAARGPLATNLGDAEATGMEGSPGAANEPARDALAAVMAPVRRSLTLAETLIALWAAGAAIFLGLTLFDAARLRRLRRETSRPDPALLSRYQALAAELSLKRPPALLVTERLESPALCGVWRPAVLMPRWLIEEAEPERVDWLLRHELTHARLCDPIGLVVRRAAECLFYFHPCVWWAGRRWEEAMELACDRAMLEDRPDAARYAEHLVGVLEHQQSRRRLPLRDGLFATRTQIGRRIEALLGNPLASPARLSALSIAGLIVVALAAFGVGVGFNEAGAQDDGGETADNQIDSVAAPPSGSEYGYGGATTPIQDQATAYDPSNGTVSHTILYSTNEEDARERINRTRSDLRTMHTALESYRVDWNAYPINLPHLTTPVAYITDIPKDPFFRSDLSALFPYAPPSGVLWSMNSAHLKYTFEPDYSAWILYGVGPDGVDQGGYVMYDPTNGVISGGDVVRRQTIDGYFRIEDSKMKANIDEQQRRLTLIKSAVNIWYLDNRRLPESLEELVEAGHLEEVPEDIFAPAERLRYRLNEDKSLAIFWSVGPDGVDDNASSSVAGYIRRGNIPPGDILETIEIAELQKHFPENVDTSVRRESWAPMLNELLELREKTGRDNAMIYYVQASMLMPPIDHFTDDVRPILADGWSEKNESVDLFLKASQRMFAEIRKGTALDHSEGIGWEQGLGTPVPNFLAAQIAAKALCAEGKKFEFEGKPQEALRNYLDVLTMGRDYSAPESILISHLISIAINDISLNCIHDLARSGQLDRESHLITLARLERIEQTQGTMAQAFETESKSKDWYMEFLLSGDLNVVRQNFADPLVLDVDGEKKEFTPNDLIRDAKRIEADYGRIHNAENRYLVTPYWEKDPRLFTAEREKLIDSVHPFVSIALPRVEKAETPYLTMIGNLRLTRLSAALELYKLDRGAYPVALRDLYPDVLPEMPVDPFSGQAFVYRRAEDGASYSLHSVGPDRVDQSVAPLYDPTNGTLSAGDISLDD